MKMSRPSESMLTTQPQLQPALLRLSAISSQYFTKVRDFYFLWLLRTDTSEILHGDCVDILRDFDGGTAKNDASLTQDSRQF
jgi:hypothetical protein